MDLGVCKATGHVYVGSVDSGIALSPTPMVSHCKLVSEKLDCHQGPDTEYPTEGFVFREDFYDPKSRIRRGRVYAARSSQPHVWRAPNRAVHGEFNTYSHCSIWAKFHNQSRKHVYVLLGDERRFTVWTLVDLEVITSGEEMVTLKALSSFGLLPELLEAEIPNDELSLIKESLEKVVNDMYTASAESVVDCCREAVSAIVGAFVNQPAKDLGVLVSLLGDKPYQRMLAQNAASIINRFHPRRKTSEIRGKDLRRITDEDAQLAVQCLGTILVELEWGRW